MARERRPADERRLSPKGRTAAYLQSRIWDRAGSLPPRSRLVYLLLHAESEHAPTGGDTPWPEFYADVIFTALTAG